jgi:hypothetical protein
MESNDRIKQVLFESKPLKEEDQPTFYSQLCGDESSHEFLIKQSVSSID